MRLRWGWVPIPLEHKGKRPTHKEWPDLRPTVDNVRELFVNGCNVGLLLGPSRVVDIDLDCPEAVDLAPVLLPSTPLRFGRDGAPASHWLYRCEGAAYQKLNVGRETLVEIRAGEGKQTVVPPSIHPTGQAVRWEPGVNSEADPAEVQPFHLAGAVRRLAAACLLIREGWSVASAADAVQQLDPPDHLPDFEHADLVRRWCGWPTATAAPTTATSRPRRQSDHATLAAFADAKAAYLRDHPGNYSSRGTSCPICGSDSGFKAANEDGKWSCFSSRHHDARVGVQGNDHWTGDQLDIDAHLANTTVVELLKEAGYLARRPPPRREDPPPYDGPPDPDHAPQDDQDPKEDYDALAESGLAHLAALAGLVETAQDAAERDKLLVTLLANLSALRALGFAMLLREAEVVAALISIDSAFRPKTTLRRFESQIRAARKAAQDEVDEATRPTAPAHDIAPLERGDELEVARRVVEEHMGTNTVFDLGAVHRYDDKTGCWQSYERHHTIQVVTRYAGAPVYAGNDEFRALRISSSFAHGAASLVESTRRRQDFFSRRAAGCGFTNGFLRADGNFVPSSPDHRLLESEVLPFEYTPLHDMRDAPLRAPLWTAFLRDLFLDDEDAEAKVRVIHQFVGATMLGIATRYQMALLLWGPEAGNGKSTLMKIVASLFSPRSRCSIPPDLVGKTFENVPLATARVNLVSDMPERAIYDTGALKAVISGDEIQFNPKNREPFTAAPRAGHFFAANTLPGVSDRSRGFWRRMLVVALNRSFDKTPEEDPDIADKVINEAPHIAACCLRAALDMERGYDIPPSSCRVTSAWEQQANNVKAFSDGFERVSLPLLGCSGPVLYSAYQIFCQEAGIKDRSIVGRNKFYDELRRMGWEQGPDKYRTWLMRPADGEVDHADAVERAEKADRRAG